MKKHLRFTCFVLVSVFICMAALAGCSDTAETQTTDTAETTTDEQSATTQETEEQQEETLAEPDEISFMCNIAGGAFPDDIDPMDNPFINAIAEKANVKFTSYDILADDEVTTKLTLMVASDTLADLSMFIIWTDDVQTHGQAGAFTVWNDIIEQSDFLSELYTPVMQKMMESSDGNIYALKAIGGADPQSTYVCRKDLIDELNDGVIPTTPEGWYEVFKKQKEKYPDSTPLSSLSGRLDLMSIFFKAYGALLYTPCQYTDGEMINSVEAEYAEEALLFYRKLYSEGMIDPTFITNTGQDFRERKFNKMVMMFPNNMLSNVSYVTQYIEQKTPGAVLQIFESPVHDETVDPYNLYSAISPIGYWRALIPSDCDNTDAAVRLTEAFLSEETELLTSWGREGEEYTVVDSENVLNAAISELTEYRSLYAMMFDNSGQGHVDVFIDQTIGLLDESVKEEYGSIIKEGVAIAYEEAALAPEEESNIFRFVKPSTELSTAVTEATELLNSIVISAIVGEISMDEYNTQIEAYLEKYGYLADEYNILVDDVKDMLSELN